MYAADPQKYRDLFAARRARKAGYKGDFNEMMNLKYDHQEGQCPYCGDLIGDRRREDNPDNPYQDEHVWPDSDGGLWDETNMVAACEHCNKAKHDKDPREWFTEEPSRLETFLAVHGPLEADWFVEMMKTLEEGNQ
jgi:5-methylcytosine-specific restriction endonuclease McrA